MSEKKELFYNKNIPICRVESDKNIIITDDNKHKYAHRFHPFW